MAVDPPAQFQQEMHRVPQGDLIRPLRKTNGVGVQADDTRICVVMVGLPARGKSLIAQKGNLPMPPLHLPTCPSAFRQMRAKSFHTMLTPWFVLQLSAIYTG